MIGTVVTAAGRGVRFGGEKILAPIGGRPLLLFTVERLARVRAVGEIVLVLAPDRLDAIRAEWGAELARLGVARFVAGGATRQESVESGVRATPEDAELVLVHDAVRPCFSVPAVDRLVEVAAESGAAVLGVPARDTLKRADGELRVAETVHREGIWHAETPQVARRELLMEAFRRAEADGFTGTDEASLVERLGAPVKMVRGGPWNLKVTEREDLAVVRALLAEEERRWTSG